MKKYCWGSWINDVWGREEYYVSFNETWLNWLTARRSPLPKRRLINNLKVLMTCPVGFKDEFLGVRISEHVFKIYDYNIKKGETT